MSCRSATGSAPPGSWPAGLLRPGGLYLAYCPPTEMSRLEKRRPSEAGLRWSLLGQKRKKGFVASAWRKG